MAERDIDTREVLQWLLTSREQDIMRGKGAQKKKSDQDSYIWVGDVTPIKKQQRGAERQQRSVVCPSTMQEGEIDLLINVLGQQGHSCASFGRKNVDYMSGFFLHILVGHTRSEGGWPRPW